MKAIPSTSGNLAATTAQAGCETDSAEVLPRQSLRSALDFSAWFDSRRAAEIACGIAAALDDAQRCGVQHLGLQPESIFINADGKVFINDADHDRLTAPRTAVQYLSPEEVRGEPADARSDLYALGIVLYEMLTDRVPFDGNDAEVIKQKHLHRVPEPPKIFRADVPDALSQLVMRLLEKDPANRPQRAADLFSELQRLIGDDVPAESHQSLNDAPVAEILTLADYAPAEFNREGAFASDDSVLDLEFNDLFVPGAALDDDATLNELPDESFAASHEPIAAEAEHLPASTIKSIERDPFDLPTVMAIEPRPAVAVAAALPAQPVLVAKAVKEKAVAAEPGDARLRWLALLLMCLVVAAALLLYNVARPAATKQNEPVTPAHPSSPTTQQAAPNPSRSPNNLPNATADENGLRATPYNRASVPYKLPSPRRTAKRSSRGNGAKAAVAPAKRRVNSSTKARSGKHRKRGLARRVMIGK